MPAQSTPTSRGSARFLVALVRSKSRAEPRSIVPTDTLDLIPATGTVTVDGAGSTWVSLGQQFVGYGGSGSLDITNGANVTSYGGLLGVESGSSGTITVDGPGSQWNTFDFSVGVEGHGTLAIKDGGQVNNPGITVVGVRDGRIVFDNGTLNTGSLRMAPSQLEGTGIINTHSLESDLNLYFDDAHGCSNN